MTCAEAADRLGERLVGALSESDQAKVDAHLRECASCTGELNELRTLEDRLRELPTPTTRRLRRWTRALGPALAAGAFLVLVSAILMRAQEGQSPAAREKTEAGRFAWVESRIREIQLTPDERKFDLIAWVDGIREALRLAQANGRPVFLLVNDGRINTGRCGGGPVGLRAAALSQDRIINLINQYYVPVYVAGEDLDKDGKLPAGEKAEIFRIYQEAHAAKMDVGDVAVFITGPDGRTIDVRKGAGEPAIMIDLLERNIKRLNTAQGKPLVEPSPQSVAPKADADALVLHLVAREDHQSKWQKFPAENWLTLDRSRWMNFLPPAGLPQGESWEIDPDVSRGLLTFFYPGTEDTRSDQVDRNVIERASIQAKVVSVAGGTTRLQLEAHLKMTRPFYPDHPERKSVPVPLEATAIGFVEIDSSKPSIRSFLLATEKATFGGKKFSVAVRRHP